jgi:hypothetical protein
MPHRASTAGLTLPVGAAIRAVRALVTLLG